MPDTVMWGQKLLTAQHSITECGFGVSQCSCQQQVLYQTLTLCPECRRHTQRQQTCWLPLIPLLAEIKHTRMHELNEHEYDPNMTRPPDLRRASQHNDIVLLVSEHDA